MTSTATVLAWLALLAPDRPMLFAEKLWIVLAVGALIGLAIVVSRAEIKKRKTRN
jgi:hypothetical protein